MVELMVALTGGLLLSIAVFMLSKHTSALYQQEARAANASLAGVVGFERLRSDIARAGFMSSPNVRRDPFVCGDPAGWPSLLGSMSSVQIEAMESIPQQLADNGVTPQRILLSGNYTSAEAFPIRSIAESGNDFLVHLQLETGAMSRLGYNSPDLDEDQRQALLESVFPAGRAVRIVDRSGRHHYGTVSSVSTNPPIVTLADGGPDLIFRDDSAYGCGLKGEETGATLNTVNFIRYELRNLSANGAYAPIYATEGPDYDAGRVELVREELDPATGEPFANTVELVAEFAVDLRFRLTVAPSQRERLLYVGENDVGDWAGDPATVTPPQGPQLIRSVHAWLSVRSREADRASGVPAPEDGPMYRFEVGPDQFARVRTVQSRIALHNQIGVTWQ